MKFKYAIAQTHATTGILLRFTDISVLNHEFDKILKLSRMKQIFKFTERLEHSERLFKDLDHGHTVALY